MARYAQDRFVNVELVTNITSGLKIPNSAITKKEFYQIPGIYRTTGGDSNSYGVLREVLKSDGTMTTEFVSVTLYRDPQEETADGELPSYYYVDMSELEAGDVLVAADSQSRFTVRDTGSLKGVYRLNLGYAVFRPIEILDQNEEYAIVSKNTSYGLSLYDHIVRNADSVNEEEILY